MIILVEALILLRNVRQGNGSDVRNSFESLNLGSRARQLDCTARYVITQPNECLLEYEMFNTQPIFTSQPSIWPKSIIVSSVS